MDSSHNNERTARVGLVYDDRMCKHSTPKGEDHPENPNRIRAIWSKLEAAGIPQRCEVFSAKEAEDRYIALVHTKKHVDLIRNLSTKPRDSRRTKIAAGFDSIYLNKGSSQAAYLAAGSVIEVSERIVKGELNSAVAIVRPPGHHAEPDKAMGFCLFNNVAIAASFLLNERPELGVQKILIVDWDVHHGNGTQKMFWKDPRVLFFSVHRFDSGNFYPSGDDGSHSMVGEGLGAGYNVNVPWEHGGVGDADYFAVWDHILIPIAKAFNPDMILISGGFDAAVGDPLGGCCITPYGYSIMMKKLMEFAHGRIMMALEGGYNLDSLANSVRACVETLLEDKPIVGSSEAYPFESTWRVIQAVREKLSTFWPIPTYELPKDLLLTTNKTSPVEELISSSDSDAKDDERANENFESSKALPVENSVDVVESLSMLKIDEHHGKDVDCDTVPVGPAHLILEEQIFSLEEIPSRESLEVAKKGETSGCDIVESLTSVELQTTWKEQKTSVILPLFTFKGNMMSKTQAHPSKEVFESCLQTKVPRILKSKKRKSPNRVIGKKPNVQLANTQPKTVVASDVQQKSAESCEKLNAIHEVTEKLDAHPEEVDHSTRVFEGQKESHTHPEEVDHSTTTLDGQENTTISKDDAVLELKQKIDDSRNKGSDEIAKPTSGPEDTQNTKETTTSPDAEKPIIEDLENPAVFTGDLLEAVRELKNNISKYKDQGNEYKNLVEIYKHREKELKKDVTNIQKNIGDLESVCVSLINGINLLKSKKSTFKIEVEQVKSNLESFLDQLKTEKFEEELRKEVTNLQKRIGDLESGTVSQISKINLLKSEQLELIELEQVKSHVESLVDQMKTEKSKVESLLDQVETDKSKTEWKLSVVKTHKLKLKNELIELQELERGVIEIQRYAIKLEQLGHNCPDRNLHKNAPPRPIFSVCKWLDE